MENKERNRLVVEELHNALQAEISDGWNQA
jgi:hypothetical protein